MQSKSCDLGTNSCEDNRNQFKDILVRHLADLADATGSAAHRAYVTKQTDSIRATDRDSLNRLGRRWSETTPDRADRRSQAGQPEALTAAERLRGSD
ncbi:hypothetical protein [Streptomyces sp. NBC_01217]|uniref:hypothetical protein n=1 Tax=Streptomyces sp. NBC_01217 TaxID=2903779 RepID=UPI002E135017|nr:hypothetical protein OG507_34940 [Streptomyces sp. NBC_01217]